MTWICIYESARWSYSTLLLLITDSGLFEQALTGYIPTDSSSTGSVFPNSWSPYPEYNNIMVSFISLQNTLALQ